MRSGWRHRSWARAARVGLIGLLGLACLGAAGCWREQRELRGAPAAATRSGAVRVNPLQPGQPLPHNLEVSPYEGNAAAIADGQQLFDWYNCSGCHAHGGGGMGPALMDDNWVYGSEPQNIHDTIVEGRPNGMPSYGGHLPDDQVWKLTVYVRSLAGLEPKDAVAPRSDHLQTGSTREHR